MMVTLNVTLQKSKNAIKDSVDCTANIVCIQNQHNTVRQYIKKNFIYILRSLARKYICLREMKGHRYNITICFTYGIYKL